MNTIYLFILLLCISLLSSCAPKPKESNNKSSKDLGESQITTTIALKNKIIFLNYSISKKENEIKNVALINKIITEGKIKKNSNRFINNAVVGDLECIQMDASNTPLKSVFIKNPLSKIIEYVNDSNNLEKRKIETNTAPFSIRLQLEHQTAFVVINEITAPNEKTNTLITTKI